MNAFETYLNLDFSGSIQDTLDKVNQAAVNYFRNKEEMSGFPRVLATYPDSVIVQTERYKTGMDKPSNENYSLSYTIEDGEVKITDAQKIDIVPTIVAKTEEVMDTKQTGFVGLIADTETDTKTAKNLAKVLLLKKSQETK